MRVILILFSLLSALVACQSLPAPLASCETTVYNVDPMKMEVTSNIVFDTTANMFRAQVVDRADGKIITEASYLLSQGTSTLKGVTDGNGEFDIFSTMISGIWQLTVSHPDYHCLEINDIPMDGGQTAIIRLKRK